MGSGTPDSVPPAVTLSLPILRSSSFFSSSVLSKPRPAPPRWPAPRAPPRRRRLRHSRRRPRRPRRRPRRPRRGRHAGGATAPPLLGGGCPAAARRGGGAARLTLWDSNLNRHRLKKRTGAKISPRLQQGLRRGLWICVAPPGREDSRKRPPTVRRLLWGRRIAEGTITNLSFWGDAHYPHGYQKRDK